MSKGAFIDLLVGPYVPRREENLRLQIHNDPHGSPPGIHLETKAYRCPQCSTSSANLSFLFTKIVGSFVDGSRSNIIAAVIGGQRK
ncbi:hypothetical protein ACJ73_01155 [Blastomyces percursus]|uniref:Uncharacterized protein n=1 Tax=Blastomyces percursus TaxID=1658174 RepID=A0A1J9QF44_9EURO|nr:hypothetical protein ACJ73_01155 [Blastomyces percursus]